MIDWLDLAANTIWIFGCAVALSMVSYASWEAHARGERMRMVLRRPRMQVGLNLAGVLFCLGVAATTRSIWEIVLWLFLAVLFAVQVWASWVKARRDTKPVPPDRL